LIKIETTRFGELEVEDTQCVEFPEGILGFNNFHQYAIIPHQDGDILWWLQSREIKELAFLICDPLIFKPDYQVSIKHEDLGKIDAESVDSCDVWVILNVSGEEGTISANLKGPIILNREKRLARQIVLDDERYGVRTPLLPPQGGE